MSFLAVISLPLLLALALSIPRLRGVALVVAPWAALPALLLVRPSEVEPPVLVSGLLLGTYLGLDSIARIFLVFTTLLWTWAGVYASTYLSHDARKHHFFAFFLVTLSGNLGLILAQDMVSFYLFFTLMTFAAYGLVVHDRSAEAYRAGNVYIGLAVVGEILLVTGLILTASLTDSHRFPAPSAGDVTAPTYGLVIGLILAGFGIKAGAVPLHVWLPLAHPVAPTPASAVLSGAMIKAGVLGWLRFLPLGHSALPGWSESCIVLGIGSAFYGVVVGLPQHHPKTVLAYSSISQMGFLLVAIGIGLTSPAAGLAMQSVVCVYALHHGLAKGALFLGVGVVNAPLQVWSRRVIWALMLLPALSLAGAPLTSGALAKAWLKDGLDFAPTPWASWLKILLPLAALGTTLLMGRFLWVLRMAGQQHDQHDQHATAVGLVLPWGILVMNVALTIWLYVPEDVAEALRTTITFATTWPVIVGTIMVAGVWWRHAAQPFSFPWHLPPGDILVLWDWAVQRIARLKTPYRELFTSGLSPALAKDRSSLFHSGVWRQGNILLRRWNTAACVFTFLLVLLLLSLW